MQATSKPVAIIVDDESGIRRFVRMAAEESGFDVLEAEHGADLLALLADHVPAVIVLDLQMAAADGVETLRELAERKITAKIILFSGTDMRTIESTRDIARRRGLDIVATLQKPVRRRELIEQLTQLNLAREIFSGRTLRKCLDRDLVGVHYQPKVALGSLHIIGAEALLRCQDELGRPVPANMVVEAAEGAGMIDELTEKVFRQALRQRQLWSKAGSDLDIAINLSPRCSFDRQLPELLAGLCQENDVPTSAVTIELTENAVMNDELLGMEALIRLRLRGFHLSIDDFGTGYSSLVRLKQLPFSEIKVDKSFVTELRGSHDNEIIVKTIIQLAQGMEMLSVVEGVEDLDALRYAARLGCDRAQGYFIARPMAGTEILGFLKSWHWRQEQLRSTIPMRSGEKEQPDNAANGE